MFSRSMSETWLRETEFDAHQPAPTDQPLLMEASVSSDRAINQV
jgi:hypothetical protein